MKIIKIFKLHKAKQLKDMGNNWLYTEPNYKRKGFRVFCFEETEKLNKDWKLIENK